MLDLRDQIPAGPSQLHGRPWAACCLSAYVYRIVVRIRWGRRERCMPRQTPWRKGGIKTCLIWFLSDEGEQTLHIIIGTPSPCLQHSIVMRPVGYVCDEQWMLVYLDIFKFCFSPPMGRKQQQQPLCLGRWHWEKDGHSLSFHSRVEI